MRECFAQKIGLQVWLVELFAGKFKYDDERIPLVFFSSQGDLSGFVRFEKAWNAGRTFPKAFSAVLWKENFRRVRIWVLIFWLVLSCDKINLPSSVFVRKFSK